jgi:outer membrane protein assembly factor BamB
VANEVIAAPVIGEGLVYVRANDGVVTAFDAGSGERRWFWQRELPALTVRGNDSVALGPGFVFVGNDDGSGPRWPSAGRSACCGNSPSRRAEGRSELDRMSDVDGTPVIDGTTLFATSFKKQTDGDRRPRAAARSGSATTAARAAWAMQRPRGRGRSGRHRVGARQDQR